MSHRTTPVLQTAGFAGSLAGLKKKMVRCVGYAPTPSGSRPKMQLLHQHLKFLRAEARRNLRRRKRRAAVPRTGTLSRSCDRVIASAVLRETGTEASATRLSDPDAASTHFVRSRHSTRDRQDGSAFGGVTSEGLSRVEWRSHEDLYLEPSRGACALGTCRSLTPWEQ